MATGSRFVLPFQTVIDMIGGVLPGAKLYFFISGTDTPLNTYADRELTVPNDNPMIADAGGRFSNIWLQPREYRVRLTDLNDDEQWTADPVVPFEDIGTATTAYDQPIYKGIKPLDNEIYPRFNIDRDCYLPANLTTGVFTVEPGTVPTADAVLTLYRKSTGAIGTLTFDTSGNCTISFPNAIQFHAGDQFYVNWPTPQDATFQDVTLTFPFQLGTIPV